MEDYEYLRTKTFLKCRVKQIREDTHLTEIERKQKLYSIARQWNAIKKEFLKDKPKKEHYNRADEHKSLNRTRKEFEDR